MTKKYTICGLVQGIGFRPSVKRAADFYNIRGTVKNIGGAVEVIAKGTSDELCLFKSELQKISNAYINEFIEEATDDCDFSDFTIAKSADNFNATPLLTPDIATCDNCISEFSDPENRRFMHPFISCVNCGPRYSVIKALPYDRKNITMSEFSICAECEEEYKNIKNTRCHAQTIACNVCGPSLFYTIDGDPLTEAAKTIKSGGVVAIKDIGGYHFACDALNASAVNRIRQIKQREAKPFAVMFNNVDAIFEYAHISDTERELLLSPARPIVLLKKKKDLASEVCGQSDSIGAFLPCNPIQHYLTAQCGALVMTSANLSSAPIISSEAEINFLHEQIGGFEILSNNRVIENPSDDSVCRVICNKKQLIRRARGYVPLPININTGNSAVLAAGSDLKAAFCYAVNGRAYMSRYFGDLENASVYEDWKKEIATLGRLLNVKDFTFISDTHPAYLSACYKNGLKLQHHYAHMASVIAEHNIDGDALGFIFDGTGYGEDGNVWGGEVIFYNGSFSRMASLEYNELLGGDEAARSSELTLDCFLYAAGLDLRGKNAQITKAAVKNHINTVKSSSMGRLFDAVSALLNISKYNSYEGESAILLENAAKNADVPYPLSLPLNGEKWQTTKLIRSIAEALDNGIDKNSLALGFHMAIVNAVCDYAEKYSKNKLEKNIILSGGVFSNELLTDNCFRKLTKRGYTVYINEQVPCNDGGIALGQAWYALKAIEK